MTAKTRYFVIVSLLVMTVGLGTGLVAYYVGFPATAFFNGDGPEELQYIPSTATVVAAVEVREIMASDLRQRLRQQFAGKTRTTPAREFQELTGINFETDIERSSPLRLAVGRRQQRTLALARGVFDPDENRSAHARARRRRPRITRARGLIVVDQLGDPSQSSDSNDSTPVRNRHRPDSEAFALTFMEPGSGRCRQHDARAARHRPARGRRRAAPRRTKTSSLTSRALEGGNVWAVGRMDVLRARAKLPDIVANQLPPITWFSIRGQDRRRAAGPC